MQRPRVALTEWVGKLQLSIGLYTVDVVEELEQVKEATVAHLSVHKG